MKRLTLLIGLLSLFACNGCTLVQPKVTSLPTETQMPTADPTSSAKAQPQVTSMPLSTNAPPGLVIPTDMVLIPAGTFQMGCDPAQNGDYSCPDDTLPLHSVYLDPYLIDKYEVTNRQYAECVAMGVCSDREMSSDYADPARVNYPVTKMTGVLGHIYCEWAGKRLPSEAEWEKAARGSSDTRAYPWGDTPPTCALANYSGCLGSAAAIGSYPNDISPYGVMDMAGNVSEWVNDWYEKDYYSTSPADNPIGPSGAYSNDKRVSRGGCWSCDAGSLSIALRGFSLPMYYPSGRYYGATGFRCARSVDPVGD
jgi:formylglycine-generating enzyme required for sulfatase activity